MMNDNQSLVLKKDNVISKIFSFFKSLFKRLDSKMNEVFEDEKAKDEDVVLADTLFNMDDEEKIDNTNEEAEEFEKIKETNVEEITDEFRKKYIKVYFQVRDGEIPVDVLSFDELFMINAFFDSEVKLLKEKIDF